MANMH